MLKNITVNNIPFFSRIVIRFIILNCELFMTRIQDCATGMYVETKEMDDNTVIKRRLLVQWLLALLQPVAWCTIR